MSANSITVSVDVQYMEDRSLPEQDHYLFAYTITLENNGSQDAQLLTRSWLITDSEGKKTEVQGPGVVGKQPVIKAGERYSYTSSAAFQTPVGTMQGSYHFRAADDSTFDIEIPCFRLAVPGILH